MGTTGATGTMSSGIPDLLERVKKYAGNIPTAIGFGVSTREHFLSVSDVADGIVIGSQIITTLGNAPPGQAAKHAEEYCAQVCGRRNVPNAGLPTEARVSNGEKVHTDGFPDQFKANTNVLRTKLGEFGGQYVPESLMDCLLQLEEGFNKIKDDPQFWEEYDCITRGWVDQASYTWLSVLPNMEAARIFG